MFKALKNFWTPVGNFFVWGLEIHRRRTAKIFLKRYKPMYYKDLHAPYLQFYEFPPRVQKLILRYLYCFIGSERKDRYNYCWCSMIKIVETDERLKRKWCTFNGGVEELRREGYSVHADILDPLVQKAAANGRLEHLSLLYGPKLSHHLLRTCMEAARTKRDMEVALECAQMLRDYQVIAEILSISGTPHQMITAQLFLEGRVSEEELL